MSRGHQYTTLCLSFLVFKVEMIIIEPAQRVSTKMNSYARSPGSASGPQ